MVRRGQTPNRPPFPRRPVQPAVDHQRRRGGQRTDGEARRDVPRSSEGRRSPWWGTCSSRLGGRDRGDCPGWASCTGRRTNRSASWPMEFERMLQSFGHASIPLAAREAVRVDVAPKAAPPVNAPQERRTHARRSRPQQATRRVIPFRVKLARAAAAVAIPLTLAGAYLLAEPAGTETLLGSNPLVECRACDGDLRACGTRRRFGRLEIGRRGQAGANDCRSLWPARNGRACSSSTSVEGRPAAGGLRVMVLPPSTGTRIRSPARSRSESAPKPCQLLWKSLVATSRF